MNHPFMNRKRAMLLFAMLVAFACSAEECEGSSDKAEKEVVNKQQDVYIKNQPAPWFDWSLERQIMIKLYEARNNAVATHSYVVSPYTGKIIAYCPSLGFPIPATTQLTNPQKSYYEHVVLPQAEPNGLYSPSDTHATWVMCLGPDGKVEPAYWEQDVMTFSRPMKEVDGRLVPQEGGASSISIDPHRPGK